MKETAKSSSMCNDDEMAHTQKIDEDVLQSALNIQELPRGDEKENNSQSGPISPVVSNYKPLKATLAKNSTSYLGENEIIFTPGRNREKNKDPQMKQHAHASTN